MANRLAERVEEWRLDPRLDKLTEEDMGLSFWEHSCYQKAQSAALAAEILTQEEAQTIYDALGEIGCERNGYWAEGTDKATKFIVTMAVAELLGVKVC